jgi:hypothetical protein
VSDTTDCDPEPVSTKTSIDHVTDLVSRLRMDRAARLRGVIVVEGPSDKDVLSRALTINKRDIFPVGGRTNVLLVASALLATPLPGVTCVADRDFDPSEDDWDDANFIVFYDDADLEAMLIQTEVLDRFLDFWASSEKLGNFGGVDAVRRRLGDTLAPLSSLRAANAAQGWGLEFDSLPLQKLVNLETLEIALDRLLRRLASGSGRSERGLRMAAEAEPPKCPHTGRPLISGKDATGMLDVALRKAIGSLSMQQISDGLTRRGIQLGVGAGDLATTQFQTRFHVARLHAQPTA